MNFGRRTADTADSPTVVVEPEVTVGKGRPTPKRAEAEKARRKATPATKKEAAAQQRAKGREERQLARQALLTGDERHLPARDAGPERRLARDIVDSRFTLGSVFFAIIFGAFALSLINQPAVKFASTLASLLGLTAMVVDSARCGRRAKTAVMEKYPKSNVVGISSYAFMRAFLPRRFRKPPPKVKRGDQVR